jgi:hypothetical protein
MNFKILRIAILIFTGLSIYSCSSRNSSGKSVVEMEFFVDSLLVDKPVRDSALSIHYAVPGSWIDVNTTDSASKLLHQAGNIRVNKILRNENNTVAFSLTDVRLVPDSTFRNLDEHYKTLLNPSGQWNNIEKAEYMTAGYQVKQFVLSKPGQTNFKLLFADKGRSSFQVDYSILVDSAYTLNTKTFESIIGSLKRDH